MQSKASQPHVNAAHLTREHGGSSARGAHGGSEDLKRLRCVNPSRFSARAAVVSVVGGIGECRRTDGAEVDTSEQPRARMSCSGHKAESNTRAFKLAADKAMRLSA